MGESPLPPQPRRPDEQTTPITTKSNHHEAQFLQSQLHRIQQKTLKSKQEQQKRIESCDPNESISDFWIHFETRKVTVHNQIHSLLLLHSEHNRNNTNDTKRMDDPSSSSRNKHKQTLESISSQIASMQLVLAQASSLYLPSADARRAGEMIKDCLERCKSAREVVCPTRKFRFEKYRTHYAEIMVQNGDNHHEDLSISCSSPVVKEEEEDRSTMMSFGYRNRTACTLSTSDEEYIRMKKEQGTTTKDAKFYLSDLIDCVVVLKEPFGSIHMSNLSNCTIYGSPIAGSAYIDKCNDTTIFLSSRQLRIHDSHNVSFHIHVLSGPIIEDCTSIKFSGCYVDYINYDGLNEQLLDCALIQPHDDDEGCGGVKNQNEYQNVKDFKWHNVLQQSPNWTIMTKENVDQHVVKTDQIVIRTHSTHATTTDHGNDEEEEEEDDDEI